MKPALAGFFSWASQEEQCFDLVGSQYIKKWGQFTLTPIKLTPIKRDRLTPIPLISNGSFLKH